MSRQRLSCPINFAHPVGFSPWTGSHVPAALDRWGFLGNPERQPANPIIAESCCLVPLVGDGEMLIGGLGETGADLGV